MHTGRQDSGWAVLSMLFSEKLVRGVLIRFRRMGRTGDSYQTDQIKDLILFFESC